MNKKILNLAILIFVILLIMGFVNYKTGIFEPENINKQDISRWQYTNDGVMKGQETFTVEGDKECCWLMIHSYTSTPDEMRDLANLVNRKFGDYVLAPRLKGHGTVPGDLNGLTLKDWYKQVEADYLKLNKKCEHINAVGSSIGGLISVRLAEEHDLHSVYLLNTFFSIPYNFYYIFKPEVYMELLAPYIHYIEKGETGRIADPEGRKRHFCYLNLPIKPLVNSKSFFLNTKSKLNDIEELAFVAHSKNDPVSSIKTVKSAFGSFSSENKKILEVSSSEHILLRDYDKWRIMQGIINFEREVRKEKNDFN